ncbi:MAG: fibronectin type III domain-containing protein [Lachnospiraceae bacterium]|nr:fibronectin type III domain-containing protein [Lachnospiraceae bacterium]
MVKESYSKEDKGYGKWFVIHKKIGLVMLCITMMLADPKSARAAGIYTEPGSNIMSTNWAYPVKCHTIAKENGSIMIIYSVLNKDKQQTLVIDIISKTGKRKNYKNLAVPGETWGGTVYQAPDGCNYITTGNDGDFAFYVMKYSSEWDLLGMASVTKEQSYTANAFQGGNSDMTMAGDFLILHAARKRMDTHQSNTTIWIDSKSMQPVDVPKEYGDTHVSHSFSQFVRYDGNRIIMIDQGDAYPRGISMITQLPVLEDKDTIENLLMKFWILDEEEDNMMLVNYTGVTVDGFELGSKHHIVVGTSIPHDRFTSGQEYNDYVGGRNVYVILIDKDLKSSKLKWLTSCPSNLWVGQELELIKIDENQFLILYKMGNKDAKESGESTHYMLINSDGDIKKSGEIPKSFYNTSEPSFDGKVLTWCHYVESELGHFMTMSRWDIETGDFEVKNIDIGLQSEISKISPVRYMQDCYTKGQKFELGLEVFSKVFKNSFPTAPAVWKSSDESVVQVLQEESILSNSVTQSTMYKQKYKSVNAKFLAKKAGTVTITCMIGDKKWSGKIKIKNPVAKPKQVEWKDAESDGKGTVILSWKKVSKVAGYQVQYSTQENFASGQSKWIKKTKTTIKGLTKTDYYFRVRAFKLENGKKVYGRWSSFWHI